MCGRFMLTTPARRLANLFEFPALDEEEDILYPRFNIAPSQPIATVRCELGNGRRLAMVQWGLVPAWAKDRQPGQGLMNACSETAAVKPSFRAAFRKRRCLVLADAFYEWQQGGKKKQPFAIRLWDSSPFAFAALWERGLRADGEPVETCAILTTQANDLVRSIHERMPVILPPDHYDVWLDPNVQQPEVLQPLLVPCDPTALTLSPVNPWLNNARHEGPRCLESVPQEPGLY